VIVVIVYIVVVHYTHAEYTLEHTEAAKQPAPESVLSTVYTRSTLYRKDPAARFWLKLHYTQTDPAATTRVLTLYSMLDPAARF
jgi:hypothetical protein